MKIIDTFQITGRGLVVVLDEATKLLAAKATITRPDGTRLSTQAFREWPLRRDPSVPKRDVFLLTALSKDDVPIGSEIELEVVPAKKP